jgi:phage terminase Nu1 subunit (DNA packaging protein)
MRPELSQLYRVSVQTISKWHRDGKLLKPRRVGKSYLWATAEVIRHLEQRDQAGPGDFPP